MIIGIAGGTGSGKSTVVRKIIAQLPAEQVSVLPQDSYYKRAPKGYSIEDLRKMNYDHPDAFDWELLEEHVRELRAERAIRQPVYSVLTCDRCEETILVKPSKVIIVDGILIFENKELRDLMDIKVYVDTDADIRLARRILRDVCERGRTMQSVITQYTSTVKPMHDEFVEPSKKYADVIIPEGGFNSVAVTMLIQNIRSLIERSR